jgi:hypothetical protein
MATQYWGAVYAVPTTNHGTGEWVYVGRATSITRARAAVRAAGYRVLGAGGLAQLGPDPMDSDRSVYSVTVRPKR